MRLPGSRTLLLAGLTLLAAAIVCAVLVGVHHEPRRRHPVASGTTTLPAPRPPANTSTQPSPAPSGFINASAGDVGPYAATVRWQTSTPAAARIEWGPAGLQTLLWSEVREPASTAAVTLEGLASSTDYVARIDAVTSSGRPESATVSFTTAPAPGDAVGRTRDGTILVNGHPFFPFVTWEECPGQWTPDVGYGIDLFAGNPCTGLSSLLAAVQGRALAVGTTDDTPGVSGPGLLGWFYSDEADARGLSASSLVPGGSGLRFLTLTGHFWSGAAPLPAGRTIYPGLISRADVVGFDLYPLQSLCRPDLVPGVFDAQRSLVTLAAPRPTFQWIEVRQMNCADPASAVTPSTIRVESWLAIAGGAHGLGFFPSDWGTAVGATIRGIATRVRQVEPALLQPFIPVQIEFGTPFVRVSARELHGALYVIAVNAATSSTPVRFDVPGLDGRTLTIAGSNKVIHTHGDVLLATLQARTAYVLVAPPD